MENIVLRQNKAMCRALEKIKAELMILGFISLLLTAATSHMAKICIPAKYEGSWVPCVKKDHEDSGGNKGGDGGDDGDDKRRKLLSFAFYATEEILTWRRSLAGATTDDPGTTCGKDKIQLISYSAAHQLHLFLFILAIVHVFYSIILMALGQAKMKKWKHWELETASMEYQFTNDPTRFRFVHQTSFVRRHSGTSKIPGSRWIVRILN
ncbi:hypothetical protein LIER_12639 [Lithospermum erythrorhizon]|uniref:MLO-like protein n=1 Tax=Lithospermum erythrorhizon TaxID=34254 RepID=A0AAV3PUY6_LITER